VPIADVREINTLLAITPVPQAPAAVRGLVNVRGQVFLILDPRVLMGYPAATPGDDSCLLLFKDAVGPAYGLLVDRIGDIIAIAPGAIVDRRRGKDQGPPAGGHDRRRGRENLVEGVAQLPEGLVMVLRSPHLLEAVRSGDAG